MPGASPDDGRAAATSYDFIDAKLRHATYMADKYRPWHRLVAELPPGPVLQFGDWHEESINRLADTLPGREPHGFDTFTGLPEHLSHSPAGRLRPGRATTAGARQRHPEYRPVRGHSAAVAGGPTRAGPLRRHRLRPLFRHRLRRCRPEAPAAAGNAVAFR